MELRDGKAFVEAEPSEVIDFLHTRRIKTFNLQPDRLYSDEKFKTEPIPGDSCGFGYNVLNSETGFRALSIQHYILRYVCTNGAVAHIGSKDERIHFGFTSNEMWEFVSKKLLQGEDSRSKLVEQIRSSNTEPATGFISGAKQRLRAIIGWRETATLLEDLPAKSTRYDLVNLIKNKAKEYDAGKKLQLESLGGMMMLNEKTEILNEATQ